MNKIDEILAMWSSLQTYHYESNCLSLVLEHHTLDSLYDVVGSSRPFLLENKLQSQ